MADRPRHRLSEQATPPRDVTDVLLWRLALDVAAAHQPDEHGNCRDLRCAGQRGTCQAARLARRAMSVARTPVRPAPAPRAGREIAVGRAAAPEPTRTRGGGFVGWFTTTTTKVRNRWTAPATLLPRRIPGAALAA